MPCLYCGKTYSSLNQTAIRNKFYKAERLCSRKQIDLLFEKNKGLNAFPLKAVYMQTTEELVFPMQAMFVVPKRNFKKAHDRNTLKRRMREAYRLNKNSLYEALKMENKKIIVAFIYTSKKAEEYTIIKAAVIKLAAGIINATNK